jgi:hypothetical protein
MPEDPEPTIRLHRIGRLILLARPVASFQTLRVVNAIVLPLKVLMPVDWEATIPKY